MASRAPKADRLGPARAALTEGRVGDAETAVRKVLARDPQNSGALHLLGVIALKTGHAAEAERHFRESIRINGQNAETHMNLGIALSMMGRREAGRASLERAAELKPTFGQAHFNLAISDIDAGEMEAGVERLRRAVRLSPKSVNIRTSLGGTLMQMGELDAGLQQFRRAAALAPKRAVVHVNLGGALQQTGDHEGAILQFQKAQQLNPDDLEPTFNIANSYATQRRTDEAIRLYEEVVKAMPDFPGGHNNHGLALRYQSRFEDAVAAFRRAREAAPDDFRSAANLAATLVQWGKGEEAAEVLQSVPEKGSDDPVGAQLGAILSGLGKFEDAAEVLSEALERNPDNIRAAVGLADIGSYELTKVQRRLLERVAGRDQGPKKERIEATLALARWHDRREQYDDAAALLAQIADLRRPAKPFDVDAFNHAVDRTIATFDGAFFAERADFGSDSDLPVFIDGPPRSGATLVERILGAHPQAYGAGEMMDLFRLTKQLPAIVATGLEFPECAASLDAATAAGLARDLVARRQALAPKAKRVVERTPLNSQALGLAPLLAPKAAIVSCRRDPMDQGLSVYFFDLSGRFPYASDLGALGGYARAHRRLMDHWASVMPVHTVSYEALVADPKPAARALVEACGLPWNSRCLKFHETDGYVVSANPWRLRQPIDQTRVGRWRHYEALLAPLREALEV